VNDVMRKFAVPAVIAASALVGGVIGVTVLAPASGSAQTTTTTAASGSSATPAAGTDTSNHDPTHEAGESAQRAADEASGKIQPGAGGHSNTDPAHEAGESAARAAEEAASDASAATTTTGG
jgi:hypothetical protein